MNDERPTTGNTMKPAWAIAFLGALLVVAATVLVTQRYAHPSPVGQARIELRKQTLAELKAASTTLLNTYAWQDPAKGIVRLPIIRALELVEQEWRNPAAARSNLIARAERASAAPTAAPGPTPRESNKSTP